ncbi:hypothetical protein HHK36_009218 [Tetracentron sinense]|uniref:Ubiquitin-like protease family profile domain-containing protein n=1 Tax=Tetracentron sinense TaxID=13715 RepID=A0A834ZF40_TETSI|nr:hypothetical protein HHK36_009218 [Tetracentron sinense]
METLILIQSFWSLASEVPSCIPRTKDSGSRPGPHEVDCSETFFPGYTKSLDDNTEIVVPDDDYRLYAIDILDPSLTSIIYKKGTTLFGYGYDFRQSNRIEKILDDLKVKLAAAYKASGGRKVNIISHSMGICTICKQVDLHRVPVSRQFLYTLVIPPNGTFYYKSVDSYELVECPSIYEMLPNPQFKWKKQPQIRVWQKESEGKETSSVKLESYGPTESVVLFEEALRNNEVQLSSFNSRIPSKTESVVLFEEALRNNEIRDGNVSIMLHQLTYDKKAIALPFNFSILRWAAGTRQILNNAQLPNGVSFYNIFGISFDMPIDVWYVTKPHHPFAILIPVKKLAEPSILNVILSLTPDPLSNRNTRNLPLAFDLFPPIRLMDLQQQKEWGLLCDKQVFQLIQKWLGAAQTSNQHSITFRVDLGFTFKPNEYTFGSLISATLSSSIDSGFCLLQQMLASVEKSGFFRNPYVGSALISGFAKFGLPDNAEKIFEQMGEKNVVSLNGLMVRLVRQKQGETATEMIVLLRMCFFLATGSAEIWRWMTEKIFAKMSERRLAKMLYRCSPSAFYKFVKEFSNEQKDVICRIGLGPLLQIHEKIHLRHHIIDFVVAHYSPESGAVMVDDTAVPLSLIDCILPHDMATKSDERSNGNGNSHPLLVPSKSMPKVDFRQRDEHPQHHDLAEILSKSLEKLSELQGIVDEHATWRVEVEKDISQRKLHDTQMACVVEKLSQKITKQDNIIETLRERLDKKETSTQQIGIHKRSIESIYFSESPAKPGVVQMNEKVSMQMNPDVSVKMNEAIGIVRVKSRKHQTKSYKSYANELPTYQRIMLRKSIGAITRNLEQAAFSTLKPAGLLDDMVVDAYLRLLDDQQSKLGPPYCKKTYYGSSHLHQFMQKCVRERKFASGTLVRANSGGFNIYQSNRVLIPVNWNGNHWFLVEVDLLRRKVIILDSMLPRRIIVGPEMRTLMAGLEYVFEGQQQEDGFAYNFTEWFLLIAGYFGYIDYWNGEPDSILFTQVRESLLQRCKEVEEKAREQATDNAILDQLCKGCPSTLGANRKSQDFFERVPARERHVKELFTEKVIHIIEKAVDKFERKFVTQGAYDTHNNFQSLDLAWTLLRISPHELLHHIPAKTLDQYYSRDTAN